MGIPGFNVWFAGEHKNAYVPLGKVRVDHLYIDLNSVLHNVMRKAKNHNHFHKLLHKRLHGILDATCPTKSVMLAVDGPAPLAKLLTQRDRRKVSKFIMKVVEREQQRELELQEQGQGQQADQEQQQQQQGQQGQQQQG
ncbi:hypothetical protein TSOC_011661 [Tetrabaena socialis]|uniref:Xrn1 N-terminal domain-containing protein n=1 Tax=Tetrabaena socialis TaxID=47790 RepID=A0A2J7ZQ31_9CHLO|nr:hypothetical protein TSOC_011661 [Tetrabaena socialis]|eukprot:PNH02366.1 hypothetical protein TSOC_011661 [Tetrabaena socialis]